LQGAGGKERSKHSSAEQSAREWGAERGRRRESKSAAATFRGERGGSGVRFGRRLAWFSLSGRSERSKGARKRSAVAVVWFARFSLPSGRGIFFIRRRVRCRSAVAMFGGFGRFQAVGGVFVRRFALVGVGATMPETRKE